MVQPDYTRESQHCRARLRKTQATLEYCPTSHDAVDCSQMPMPAGGELDLSGVAVRACKVVMTPEAKQTRPRSSAVAQSDSPSSSLATKQLSSRHIMELSRQALAPTDVFLARPGRKCAQVQCQCQLKHVAEQNAISVVNSCAT